jgi:hypothetical protein
MTYSVYGKGARPKPAEKKAMVIIGLVLCSVAPLLAAVVLPNGLAPDAHVPEAILMTAIGLIVIGLMELWLKRPDGAAVFSALGWRYRLLQFAIVAVLSTLAMLLLFVSLPWQNWQYGIITAELGLLLVAGGLASMRAPRNRVIGFRTRRTLANDETWRAENWKWGRRLAMVGTLVVLAALSGSWGPLLAAGAGLGVGIAFLVEDRRVRRQHS